MNLRPENINLNDVQFTPELLRCVPSSVARKYRTVPVSSSSSPDLLCLALDKDGWCDIDTTDGLCWTLRRDLKFVIAESSQLDTFLERLYGKESDRVVEHMSRVPLLTVKDCFLIEGRGIMVIPDFSVPDGWKDRTEIVEVTTPDGREYEAAARFSMSHFRLIDPKAPIDKRWRVVVLLLNGKKEELPVGSKILVSEEIRDAILPHNVA